MKEQKEIKETTEVISLLEQILARTDKEITKIHNYYRLTATLLAVIIAVGIFFSYSTVSDFKKDIKEDMEIFKIRTKAETKNYADSMKINTNNEVGKVRTAVVDKINSEFDADNIAVLVNNSAKERVDKVADGLVKKRVDERVKVSEKQLNDLSIKASNDISYLKVQLFITAALNDDRFAFDSLKAIIIKQKSFMNEAKIIVENIINKYASPSYSLLAVTYLEINKYTIDQLKDELDKSSSSNKYMIIEEVWERKNVNIAKKTNFLIDIIKKDRNLSAVSYASKKLIEYFKLDYKSLEVEKILNWWDMNRSQIK